MTDPIRTPDDEKPIPWLYPPFLPGRIYHAATYRGHSSGAIDMNRRTADGGWRQDLGDPVLAAQDGKVVRVDRPSGTVEIDHGDGWRTRYVHMQNITARVGQPVPRGEQIGEVGDEAGGTASSFGPHLHFQVLHHGKPVQVRFEGKPVRTSVVGSDSKPVGWDAPDPVEVIGPPPRATWKGAYQEAERRNEKLTERISAKDGRIALVEKERDDALARVRELETRPDTAALEADNDRLTREAEAAAQAAQQAVRDRDAAMKAQQACEDASAPLEAFFVEVEAAVRRRREAA